MFVSVSPGKRPAQEDEDSDEPTYKRSRKSDVMVELRVLLQSKVSALLATDWLTAELKCFATCMCLANRLLSRSRTQEL